MRKIYISLLDVMYLSEESLKRKLEKAGFELQKDIRTEDDGDGRWYKQEEEAQMMNLRDFLNLQEGLDKVIMDRQAETGRAISKEELLSCRLLALFTETGEFCNELGSFKYWKQSHKVDEEKAISEFADMLFFVFSVANLKGYTASDIQEAYMKKWNENMRRQRENY